MFKHNLIVDLRVCTSVPHIGKKKKTEITTYTEEKAAFSLVGFVVN